jgi:hypothetical protein
MSPYRHLVSRWTFGYKSCRTVGVVPRGGTKVLGFTYEQGGLRVRVGEERGGKEIDRYPLTETFKYWIPSITVSSSQSPSPYVFLIVSICS